MRRRTIPPLLPTLLVLGLLGVWAGTGSSAIPDLPTVSLPTVTVAVPPTPPTPLPPPPTVTVTPPSLPPPPPPPKPPVDVTVPVPVPPVPAVPTPPPPAPPPSQAQPAAPAFGAGGASSRFFRQRARRRSAATATPASIARVPARPASAEPTPVATLRAHRPIAEQSLGARAVGALEEASQAIPSALFAMAALAVLLLAVAAMPQPVAGSRAGAMLVHKRGSIAVAGTAALAMAVATYLLL